MKLLLSLLVVIFSLNVFTLNAFAAKPEIKIASKNFTEAYILAEIISQVAEDVGEVSVERKAGMGDTGILFEAIKSGEIDIYPEYTGTLAVEILKNPDLKSTPSIRQALEPMGLTISESLGFNNTYAIGVREALAKKYNLQKVSDMGNYTNFRVAMSHPFLTREDGFFKMLEFYGITGFEAEGMEHALAYEAIASEQADVTDVWTTDSKIKQFNLRVLQDDKSFFPSYQAVLLVRKGFVEEFPKTWARLKQLEGRFDDQLMMSINAQVDLDKKSYAEAAAVFLGKDPKNLGRERFWSKLTVRTWQHLFLVFVSLLAAIGVGVPLGMVAFQNLRLRQSILMMTGLVQTIPSLALLCFMIPFLGIGFLPSIVALFLYGLLPIVRSTYSGLISIDDELSGAADAMNLTKKQKMRLVQMPLASTSIMSGIKTSAVINVGTATIAAFIGAGGYGAFIVEGLSLNEISIILQGAVPAAILAILIHGLFEIVDRMVIPKGLR